MDPKDFIATVAYLPLEGEVGRDALAIAATLDSLILRAREIVAEAKRAKRPEIKSN